MILCLTASKFRRDTMNIKYDCQPLISVIMNCYNGETYLRESIDSVLSQTYNNWEIIFWDNQSTDNSAKIFKSYKDNRLHYFLAEQFTTLSRARNLAVSKANGEWINFLDCDDVLLPEKMSCQMDIIINEKTELGFIYGEMRIIGSHFKSSSMWVNSMRRYNNKSEQ